MAQVPGYEYDIFISYTHDDNVKIAGSPGWVDVFHEALENWLVKRRDLSRLKIWRDGDLDGNTLFDDAIKHKVNNTALFFALNSRNYRHSAYCRQELDWFHQYNSENHRNLAVGERLRIFHLLLNNIPHQEWPEALGHTSGFAMHDARSETDLGDFTSPRDVNFERQLRKVVDAVEAILKEFPTTVDSSEQTATKDTVRIFFGDVTGSQQGHRKRLIAKAESSGAVVLKKTPPPYALTEHATHVQHLLEQASFAVHLLDQWPGPEIANTDSHTYQDEQVKLGLKSHTPQLIWVPQTVQPDLVEDEAHRTLIERLETGKREHDTFDFVRGPESTLADLIEQRIKESQNASQAENDDVISFLVDTHQRDQRYAFNLAAYLAEHNMQVDFNMESRDPMISLNRFEQSVSNVRNLIVLCGQVAPAWLKGRIVKAVKIVANNFEGDAHLENIWIYLVPGDTGVEAIPRVPPLFKINVLDNKHTDDIDPDVAGELLLASRNGG